MLLSKIERGHTAQYLRYCRLWSRKGDKSPLTPCGFTANLKNGHRMKKRTKRLEIALSEDEYNALLERKTKARLAEWVREVALEQQPKRQPKVIDPTLLFELNRIGVNLNQIARQCNSQRPSIDLVSVLAELRAIEKNLKALRELSL